MSSVHWFVFLIIISTVLIALVIPTAIVIRNRRKYFSSSASFVPLISTPVQSPGRDTPRKIRRVEQDTIMRSPGAKSYASSSAWETEFEESSPIRSIAVPPPIHLGYLNNKGRV